MHIFDPAELIIMRDSLALLCHDVSLLYQGTLDRSHHGTPIILTEVHEGGRGRPKLVIDRDWLEWAYGQKSISAIASFLGLHRSTVRRALIDYGICEPLPNPFPSQDAEDHEEHESANLGTRDAGSQGEEEDILDRDADQAGGSRSVIFYQCAFLLC